MLATIKRELPKTVLSVVLSAVGFLIALAINQAIEDNRDQETFQALAGAIRAEANANAQVLSNSFDKYFGNGIVLANFNTSTSLAVISNPQFARKATTKDIAIVDRYIRDLDLANSYAKTNADLLMRPSPVSRDWAEGMNSSWPNIRARVVASIQDVEKLEDP